MLPQLFKTSLVALLLAGCAAHSAQTTSGAAYLARYSPPKQNTQSATRAGIRDGKLTEVEVATISTDDLIRRAAAVEPLLEFPARFGLARIEHGQLTTVPAVESAAWVKLGQRHTHLGSFAPIDPFLAGYVQRTILPQDRFQHRRDAHDLLTKIRLGAARQHMDAVLIYEVGGRGDPTEGLSRIRVLGDAPLSSKPIDQEGVARAFLMDVRNGYPYGTASASADLEDVAGEWWDDRSSDPEGIAAKERIINHLMPEVEAMFSSIASQVRTRIAAVR